MVVAAVASAAALRRPSWRSGDYLVTLTVGGKTYKQLLRVERVSGGDDTGGSASAATTIGIRNHPTNRTSMNARRAALLGSPSASCAETSGDHSGTRVVAIAPTDGVRAPTAVACERTSSSVQRANDAPRESERPNSLDVAESSKIGGTRTPNQHVEMRLESGGTSLTSDDATVHRASVI